MDKMHYSVKMSFALPLSVSVSGLLLFYCLKQSFIVRLFSLEWPPARKRTAHSLGMLMNFAGRSPFSVPVARQRERERENSSRKCAFLVLSFPHGHRSAVRHVIQSEASIITQITHVKCLRSCLRPEDSKGRKMPYKEPPQSAVSANTSSSFLPPQSRKLWVIKGCFVLELLKHSWGLQVWSLPSGPGMNVWVCVYMCVCG